MPRMGAEKVHLNGRLVPADEACVGVSDAGFLHGASCFTTMLAHNGVVFRFARHLRRLMDTVAALGLRTGATAESLGAATCELLAVNELRDARVRITLTPGAVSGTRTGGDEGEDAPKPTTLITASPLAAYPREWYEKGIDVIVSSLRQAAGDPMVGLKTGCYLPRVLARREAAAKGVDEALWFTTDGRLAEACFCNVFLVLSGKVHTPPIDTPVLPGVVREAVIELCGGREIACEAEAPLTIHELLAAEEVFLTSSTMGIRPVVRIESHDVGAAAGPGALTRIIGQAYQELLDRECSAPGGRRGG